ncbi:hypothetical protein C8R44DRAFT_129412 [Mycena epipterygia]|nr:hypothetical protein C8R44DRAFT_129412 [Mycena epipterygia]
MYTLTAKQLTAVIIFLQQSIPLSALMSSPVPPPAIQPETATTAPKCTDLDHAMIRPSFVLTPQVSSVGLLHVPDPAGRSSPRPRRSGEI